MIYHKLNHLFQTASPSPPILGCPNSASSFSSCTFRAFCSAFSAFNFCRCSARTASSAAFCSAKRSWLSRVPPGVGFGRGWMNALDIFFQGKWVKIKTFWSRVLIQFWCFFSTFPVHGSQLPVFKSAGCKAVQSFFGSHPYCHVSFSALLSASRAAFLAVEPFSPSNQLNPKICRKGCFQQNLRKLPLKYFSISVWILCSTQHLQCHQGPSHQRNDFVP